MKTKPTPRARRMWANYYKDNFLPALHPSRKSSIQHCAPSVEHKSVPVAVIPLDDPMIGPALSALGIRLAKGGAK